MAAKQLVGAQQSASTSWKSKEGTHTHTHTRMQTAITARHSQHPPPCLFLCRAVLAKSSEVVEQAEKTMQVPQYRGTTP